MESECPLCRGATWVPVEAGNGLAVRRCECQVRKIAEDRIRVVLRDWPEYKDARLEGFKPRNVGQSNALMALRDNPRGSYLFTGRFSRGKTHLMVAQYRHLALAGERCLLRSARDLMEELRRAEAPPDKDGNVYESPVMQLVNLAPAGHLFVDDIEKASARSEFRAEMIFDLLDTIKRRQLAITVTSNLPIFTEDKEKKDIRAALGEAAAARLYKLCKEIEL